jgi:hypothetical protein
VVGRRSTKVGTYAGTFHVIPAGMMNLAPSDVPHLISEERCFRIRPLIEKEFVEEVFSQEWAASCNTEPNEPWHRILARYSRRHIYGENDRYETSIHFTGLVFDLLNYRPEVCALVLIRNRDWWDDHDPHIPDADKARDRWDTSYEWDSKTVSCPLVNPGSIYHAAPPAHWVGSGLAAYELGVRKATALLSAEGRL